MSDVRAKAIEEANAIIESHDQLEKIAITTFSKLGPLGHIHIRNTLLDITMSNGIAVHFGKWNARGCDPVYGNEGTMGVTLPGSPMAFLCKHRIDTLAATHEACPLRG